MNNYSTVSRLLDLIIDHLILPKFYRFIDQQDIEVKILIKNTDDTIYTINTPEMANNTAVYDHCIVSQLYLEHM